MAPITGIDPDLQEGPRSAKSSPTQRHDAPESEPRGLGVVPFESAAEELLLLSASGKAPPVEAAITMVGALLMLLSCRAWLRLGMEVPRTGASCTSSVRRRCQRRPHHEMGLLVEPPSQNIANLSSVRGWR